MTPHSPLMASLGWTDRLAGEHDPSDPPDLVPARISAVHRDRLTAISDRGSLTLALPGGMSTTDIAVGDWALANATCTVLVRLLPRTGRLARRAAGDVSRDQLIAANVDTVFLTTSCNADFNEARLERYLALIHQGAIAPVLLLTKADQCPEPEAFLARARAIAPDAPALALNARDPATRDRLAPWTAPGQTLCFLGSSGVGKSTLANTLTGLTLDTGDIREDDAKGRHTTTARALFPIPGGGWLIDTPGMRELRLSDVTEGIGITFADLAELASHCRFRDCEHGSEPGCAVQAAIAVGTLDADRLRRWQKLAREDEMNRATAADLRARARRFGKATRDAGKHKRPWSEDD